MVGGGKGLQSIKGIPFIFGKGLGTGTGILPTWFMQRCGLLAASVAVQTNDTLNALHRQLHWTVAPS